MAHAPTGPKPITTTELKKLLDDGKADPTFRNKLLTSPEATLTAEGLKADPHWVHFFKAIQSSDFEAIMQSQIDIFHGEG